MTTSAQESTSAHFYTEKKEGHGKDDSRYCNKNKHQLRKKYKRHTIKLNNEKLVNKASGSYGINNQELEQVKFRIHIHQSNKMEFL